MGPITASADTTRRDDATRFAALDSWRGIAALLVALLHFRFLGHFYSLDFVRNSWLFVDFFFVLSGFVITHAYAERLRRRSEVLPFVIRRFGRLWPLHAVTLAIFAGFELVKWALMSGGRLDGGVPAFDPNERYSIPSLVTNLLMVHSLGIHDKLTWNLPSWSISTEFYTYLVFAALCWLSRPALNFVLAAVALGCFWIVAHSGTYLNTTYQYGFFRTVMGFFVGSLTYRAHQGFAFPPRTRSTHTAIEATAIAALLLFVNFCDGPASMAADFFFAATIFVFADQRGGLSGVLLTKPFQRLGEWSYSIYMLHTLLLMLAMRVMSAAERIFDVSLRTTYLERDYPIPMEVFFFWNKTAMDALALLYLFTLVLLSAISFRLIEAPGRRYFNRLATRAAARSDVDTLGSRAAAR